MPRLARLTLLDCLILCLCLPVALPATAQVASEHTLVPGGTVSVVALRIPPKAREHLEKARHAIEKHREDVYEREVAKALAIAPDFSEAYLLRADHENSAASYEAAVEDALKAQALDPTTAWPCVVLATAYNGEARHQDAFVVLGNLHGEGAASWQAKYEMARAEVGRGDVEGALHWSKLALASAPTSFLDARLQLANALQIAHRWREAGEQMEVYLASNAPLLHRRAVELALTHTRLLAEKAEREEALVR